MKEELAEARALRVRARAATELADLATHRAVHAANEVLSQREMSAQLGVSQPEIHRILKRIRLDPSILERSAREVALLYAAGRLSQSDMLRELIEWPWVSGDVSDTHLHEPESYRPGSSDELVRAADEELISAADYELIVAQSSKPEEDRDFQGATAREPQEPQTIVVQQSKAQTSVDPRKVAGKARRRMPRQHFIVAKDRVVVTLVQAPPSATVVSHIREFKCVPVTRVAKVGKLPTKIVKGRVERSVRKVSDEIIFLGVNLVPEGDKLKLAKGKMIRALGKSGKIYFAGPKTVIGIESLEERR